MITWGMPLAFMARVASCPAWSFSGFGPAGCWNYCSQLTIWSCVASRILSTLLYNISEYPRSVAITSASNLPIIQNIQYSFWTKALRDNIWQISKTIVIIKNIQKSIIELENSCNSLKYTYIVTGIKKSGVRKKRHNSLAVKKQVESLI